MMGLRLMRFVEGVRFCQRFLMVKQSRLLLVCENGVKLVNLFTLSLHPQLGVGCCGIHLRRGKVVVVPELGKKQLLSKLPCLSVIVGDIGHVPGIDSSEGSKAQTNQVEERDEDIVDDVDGVELLVANIYPPDEKQNPSQALRDVSPRLQHVTQVETYKKCDKRGIKGDEEPQRLASVLDKRLEALLHL